MKKYNFNQVPLYEIFGNPEKYIIPECVEACTTLLDKGIEIRNCSTNDRIETDYWIQLEEKTLSEENKYIIDYMLQNNKEYFVKRGYGHPTIKVPRNEMGIKLLNAFSKMFYYQDSNKYLTDEGILYNYKMAGGEKGIINPERENATLEEALEDLKKDEGNYKNYKDGRLYLDDFSLSAHHGYELWGEKTNKGRKIIEKAYREIVYKGYYDLITGSIPIDYIDSMCKMPEKMYKYINDFGTGTSYVFAGYMSKILCDNHIQNHLITTGPNNGEELRFALLCLPYYRKDFCIADPTEDILYFKNNGINKGNIKDYYFGNTATKIIDGKVYNASNYTFDEYYEKYGDIRLLDELGECGRYDVAFWLREENKKIIMPQKKEKGYFSISWIKKYRL